MSSSVIEAILAKHGRNRRQLLFSGDFRPAVDDAVVVRCIRRRQRSCWELPHVVGGSSYVVVCLALVTAILTSSLGKDSGGFCVNNLADILIVSSVPL